VVADLVRHHLLLPHTATRRDVEDPSTVALVAERVRTPRFLDLLAALTEADARATGPAAWSAWRRRLVRELVARTRAVLVDHPVAPVAELWPGLATTDIDRVWVDVEAGEDGSVLVVGAPDRVGLLADVSGAVALSGLHVRSARAATCDGVGWSRWEVVEQEVDPARLRQRLLAQVDGARAAERLRPPPGRAGREVLLHPHDSARATVLEVRDHDWRGLLHTVCAALADLKLQVRSAHVETLGPQAVDVFYVEEVGGGSLSEARAAATVDAVAAALAGAGS
jgi:[protein-PII] uridylyltransferase